MVGSAEADNALSEKLMSGRAESTLAPAESNEAEDSPGGAIVGGGPDASFAAGSRVGVWPGMGGRLEVGCSLISFGQRHVRSRGGFNGNVPIEEICDQIEFRRLSGWYPQCEATSLRLDGREAGIYNENGPGRDRPGHFHLRSCKVRLE